LLIVPGPLTVNFREWWRPLVPRLEVGELGGHCHATPHRVTLWKRAAPRIGGGPFLELLGPGAPEGEGFPRPSKDRLVDRALECPADDCRRTRTRLLFVSARDMWVAIDAVRRGAHPETCVAFAHERVPPIGAAS